MSRHAAKGHMLRTWTVHCVCWAVQSYISAQLSSTTAVSRHVDHHSHSTSNTRPTQSSTYSSASSVSHCTRLCTSSTLQHAGTEKLVTPHTHHPLPCHSHCQPRPLHPSSHTLVKPPSGTVASPASTHSSPTTTSTPHYQHSAPYSIPTAYGQSTSSHSCHTITYVPHCIRHTVVRTQAIPESSSIVNSGMTTVNVSLHSSNSTTHPTTAVPPYASSAAHCLETHCTAG